MTSNSLYNLFIKNCFSIKGRASRKEYIIRFVLMMTLAVINSLLYDLDDILDDSKVNLMIMFLSIMFFCILLIISVIQMFFVTHRRLHDLNASGWWQLLTFIPFGQLLMIGFIFFKGTPGRNRFGEPPE